MTYRPYDTITAVGISDQRQNVSGSLMAKATPVRSTSTGDIDFIDVSDESHAFAVNAVTGTAIANLSLGPVFTSGRLTNITITGSFGDPVFVSKTGGLTTTKPSIGVDGFVSGDWIIMIGSIGKNADVPANKDLVLNIGVVGQL
ncbi:MAG TPA: hypothetical protein DDY18_11030 [Flavobacterium sp.]|nr:hypothetical protein [Flavobacterium sp.]